MKKTKLIVTTLAVCACVAAGALFGCSQSDSDQSAQANLTDYEKIIQANTVEKLAGDNGTLACSIETYGEESTLEDTMAIQWVMSNGTPSLKWIDTMDDVTQYSMSEYANGTNSGAIYSIEDGVKYATIYPQENFSNDVFDEWNTLIDYEGTQSDVAIDGNTATLEVSQEAAEGETSYYKAVYTFDPTTYVLSSLEVTDYSTEDNAVLDKVIIKDISTTANLDLPENPYEQITGADENQSCNLTVVVNQLNGDKVTSTYKVARDTIVEIGIPDDFDMYSDEAMTTLIQEIDVSGANATVYIQVRETTNDDDGQIDAGNEAPGTEHVFEDGTVLTRGEDGQLYDEEGNVVQLDETEQ